MFSELIVFAKYFMGWLYLPVYHFFFIIFPFSAPTNLNWIFLLSAMLLALFFYLRYEGSSRRKSLLGFRQYLFPKSIYRHESAIDDYKFYIVNAFFVLKFASWVATSWSLFVVADMVRFGMIYVMGGVSASLPAAFDLALFSIFILLALDFAKWLAHYLEHTVPVLWEFHKVHHSAEVLTPVTNYRLHPVDFIVEQSLLAIVTGIVAGVFSYWFPSGLAEYTIFNMSAFLAVFWLTNYLRHTHIPLSYGRFNYIFSSPVLHQVHHSSETRHLDKNFALIFSFWDYFAGTLYVPEVGETYKFGLYGDNPRPFHGVLSLYFAPFRNAFRLLRPRRRAQEDARQNNADC
jgi:sterol desaturase/sphingolipid hydroxylase (fatty acid hydroxylase superfamily)